MSRYTRSHRSASQTPRRPASLDYSAEAQEDDLLDADENADPSDGFEVGDERTGRLAQEEGEDDIADDVGIDGAAASAEEAAMHTVDEDLP